MKFIKFCIGLLLLPALWSSLRTGGVVFADVIEHNSLPWASLAWFSLGFLLWVAIYFTLPRPTRLYVFGHEFTHALAVWMSGGKVSEFKVEKGSGYIVSDKISAWIALAPYLFPLYPAVVCVIWLIIRFFFPEWGVYEPFFLAIWGAVWSFHLCFTASVMKTEQSDFASQGYFFSFVVIFLCNWLLFLVLFIYGMGLHNPLQYAKVLGHYLAADYKIVFSAAVQMVQMILVLFK